MKLPAFTARVLTLFPDMFPGPLGVSLVGKALDSGLWDLQVTDIRDFGHGKHRQVDDTPAGGGPGMVMRPDVLGDAIDAARVTDAALAQPLIYLSPRGKRLEQRDIEGYMAAGGVTLLCGRFEGVDERLLEVTGAQEISLGDFVLAGGEIAAMALIEATVRLLPGVVGDPATLDEESFTAGLLEYPQYTRPQVWRDREIPEVLTSGHHGDIAKWRREQAEHITRQRRTDLWQRYTASHNEDEAGPAEGETES